MTEELHHPWVKRLLIGFARTSEFNGPRMPDASHSLIQEIDCELPVAQPALQLTYKIFGSCPPIQSFDPAKLLTVRIFLVHFVVSLLGFNIYLFLHYINFYYFLIRILGSFRLLIYC